MIIVANLFERLSRSRPPEPKIEQPAKDPAQLLLTWLQRWPEDTVTVRDIRVYGPKSIRDREHAISAAETLATNGWLEPTKPNWPGTFAWKVLRKNVVHPAVAM